MSGGSAANAQYPTHPPDVPWVATHAGTEIVFVDAGLTETFAAVRRDLPSMRHVVVMGDPSEAVDPGLGDYVMYEELLAGESSETDWPHPDENTAAVLLYTSGTTGRPKESSTRTAPKRPHWGPGRRSHGHRRADIVALTGSAFHANSWGLAYSTGLAERSWYCRAGTCHPLRCTLSDELDDGGRGDPNSSG